MIRAMDAVVLPAIPEASPRAREQAAIMLASLKVVLTQEAHRFDEIFAGLRLEAALLEHLVDHASDGKGASYRTALAAGRRVAELDVPSQARMEELTLAMRSASDEILRSLSDETTADLPAAARTAVIDYARTQVLRWRVGNLDCGFENNPSALPSLGDVLVGEKSA
jgi:hypothetical protein